MLLKMATFFEELPQTTPVTCDAAGAFWRLTLSNQPFSASTPRLVKRFP
jgi:hypothetical protein